MLVCHILSLWINCQYATINHSGQPSTGTCNIIIGICRPQVSHLMSVHVVCLDKCQLIYQVYMCLYVGYPSLCHVSCTCIMPSTIHLCTYKITIGISLMSQSTTVIHTCVIYLVVYAACSDKLWLMPDSYFIIQCVLRSQVSHGRSDKLSPMTADLCTYACNHMPRHHLLIEPSTC